MSRLGRQQSRKSGSDMWTRNDTAKNTGSGRQQINRSRKSSQVGGEATRPERVIIISFDAMGARDLAFMRTLPNFQEFAAHAAVCEQVQSVYPSITYPAHTSIITGRLPKHHGIINNTLTQPKRPSPDWYWQRKYIKGTTLYDEAVKHGWKTAALLWPVTARSRIHYNIPEVLANRPWQNQIMVSAYNSSFFYALTMHQRYGHLRDGVRQPALDNFVQACALDTIYRHNPDLFLIHFTDLDTNRHIYGLDHTAAFEAMKRHDERLGELLRALAATGDMEKTTVILLGDHCQLDTKQIVYLNFLLKEKGYLSAVGGRITDYKVLAKNCDGSCYLYLHPAYRNDAALKAELTELFTKLAKEKKYGIDRILTGQQAGELGADETCFLMMEARDGYYFLDECETLTRSVSGEKKHKMRATHGYLPDKPDYQTFFMAKGCGIRRDVTMPAMTLYDEGPTLARLMGLDLGKTDGRILWELLLDQNS